MLLDWSPSERKQLAISVAEGRLDYRIARALLDGYLDLEGEVDRNLIHHYMKVCSILGIPLVIFVRKSVAETVRTDFYGIRKYGASVGTSFEFLPDIQSPEGQRLERFAQECGGWPLDGYTWAFPSEEHARRFLHELLNVLSTKVRHE